MRDYVKFLKSVSRAPEFVLEPFAMSVLLYLSEIFENEALDVLGTAIRHRILENENRKRSDWLERSRTSETRTMSTVSEILSNR